MWVWTCLTSLSNYAFLYGGDEFLSLHQDYKSKRRYLFCPKRCEPFFLTRKKEKLLNRAILSSLGKVRQRVHSPSSKKLYTTYI